MQSQCPHNNTKVIDTRKSLIGFQVVRHRTCLDCGKQLFTREIEDNFALRDLSVFHFKRYYFPRRKNAPLSADSLPAVETVDRASP